MRIAVIGLGGVGAYIGAKLCALKNEHEILFISRGEQLKQIEAQGLRLIDVNEEQVYHPTSTLQKADGHLDIVFLCTKSYHFKQAMAELAGAVSEETLIIPIANGVNNAEQLRKMTLATVTDACVYIVSHQISPGVVKKATNIFALILDERVKSILEPLLEKTELRYKFSSEIKKELWKKFLFISSMGTLTSFYNIGMGSVYQEHKSEFTALLEEISNLAKAEGVIFEDKERLKALETASKLPLEAPTSLWLDLKNGKENELENLCDYVIETARKHKLPVPLMQKIHQKLHTIN